MNDLGVIFQKSVLDNGLVVVSEAVPYLKSIALSVFVKVGSRDENEDPPGVSHFMEHLFFKGTTRRSCADIAQEIDAIGGLFDAFTSKEYTGFFIKVLDEHLETAVDLLWDILLRPLFAEEHVTGERSVIIDEIRMVDDNPEEVVHEQFNEAFYGNHPLARPILGTRESVGAMRRDDVLRYYGRFYKPDRFVIAAAGNVEHDRLLALLAVQASRQPLTGVSVRMVVAPPVAHFGTLTRQRDLEQIHFTLGFPAPQQDDPDRFPAHLLTSILGGTMSSRLFQIVREEHGLVYSIYASRAAFHDTGYLSICAGCAPEVLGQVLSLTADIIADLKRDGVEEAELERCKQQFRGSFLLGQESSSARMTSIAQQEIYFGRRLPPEETLQEVAAVTLQQVQDLANRVLRSEQLCGVFLGPLDESCSALAELRL
ncbi:MAG: insulinase family protein [Candidatus Schekmanbacteria bacterium]|nr:insulinase family protein [Candidatus Schekmanbacteria bacterium]